MEQNEQLIGFDARIMWLDFEAWWHPERKSTYLINESVSHIFSVDTVVWPRVFDLSTYLFKCLPTYPEEIPEGPKLPEVFIGANDPFWGNIEELKKHLAQHSGDIRKPYWIIAVTYVDGENKEKTPYLGETSPRELNQNWSFLGYDVADPYISGITNCGFSVQDLEKVARAEFGAKINENHLFDSVDEAVSFQTFTDTRIPEHSPFNVYGLYLVEKVE